MRSKIRIVEIIVLCIVALTLIACNSDIPQNTEPSSTQDTMSTARELTINTWADGNIAASGSEQWYKFTATADKQYIHLKLSTFEYANVQLYYSSGEPIDIIAFISDPRAYFSFSVTKGQMYYVKVTGNDDDEIGTFQITFATSTATPERLEAMKSAKELTFNTMTAGSIADSSSEEWYKFTTTASKQYIHVTFNTLERLKMTIYDNVGDQVGDYLGDSVILGNDKYTSFTAETSKTYYLKVIPLNDYTGTYHIGFNETEVSPDIYAGMEASAELSINIWVNGEISSSTTEQWYKFTASANEQYLHFAFKTLSDKEENMDFEANIYDNTGAVIGTNMYFFGSISTDPDYESLELTEGHTYYIKLQGVTSEDSGIYKISFSDSSVSPDIIAGMNSATELTSGEKTDGNIISSATEQWYKFTTTTDKPYLYIFYGTLNKLNAQLYNSTGDEEGIELIFENSNPSNPDYEYLYTATKDQTYYVRVKAYDTNETGTYQISYYPNIS